METRRKRQGQHEQHNTTSIASPRIRPAGSRLDWIRPRGALAFWLSAAVVAGVAKTGFRQNWREREGDIDSWKWCVTRGPL